MLISIPPINIIVSPTNIKFPKSTIENPRCATSVVDPGTKSYLMENVIGKEDGERILLNVVESNPYNIWKLLFEVWRCGDLEKIVSIGKVFIFWDRRINLLEVMTLDFYDFFVTHDLSHGMFEIFLRESLGLLYSGIVMNEEIDYFRNKAKERLNMIYHTYVSNAISSGIKNDNIHFLPTFFAA